MTKSHELASELDVFASAILMSKHFQMAVLRSMQSVLLFGKSLFPGMI